MAGENDNTGPNEWNLEKPLSPVLFNKTTRKYRLNRKIQRKSRVKLTERFSETDSLTSNETSKKLLDESSINDADFETLEEKSVEKCSAQYKSGVTEHFDFRQPNASILSAKSADINFSEGGFTTARGKQIHFCLSDDAIKQSKRLFEDILYSGQQIEVKRSNKYSFLSKKQSNENSENCTPQQSNSIFEKENVLKVIPKEDTFIKSTCTLKLSDNIVEENINKMEQEIDILCTQEINEMLSEFTVLENSPLDDTVIEKKEEDSFKGFSKEIIEESRNVHLHFTSVVSQFTQQSSNGFRTATGSKYHVSNPALPKAQQNFKGFHKTSPLTTRKTFKSSDIEKIKSENCVPNNTFLKSSFQTSSKSSVNLQNKVNTSTSQQNQFSNTVSGFKTAGGKKYHVSNLAFSKAQHTFQDFDFGSEVSDSCSEIASKNSEKMKSSNLCGPEPDGTSLKSELLSKTSTLGNAPQKIDVIIPQGEKFFTSVGGFTTAAGKKCHISNLALTKAQQTFKDSDFAPVIEEKQNQNLQNNFSIAPDKNIDKSECSNKNNQLSSNTSSHNIKGFSTAAGNKFQISNSALAKVQQTFKDIEVASLLKQSSIESSHSFSKVPEKSTEKSEFLSDIGDKDFSQCWLKEKVRDIPSKNAYETNEVNSINMPTEKDLKKDFYTNNSKDCSLNDRSFNDSSTLQGNILFRDGGSNMTVSNTSNISRVHKSRRLGMSTRTQIAIPADKIEKAMKIFEDKSLSMMSPLKNNVSRVYNSTPFKKTSFVPMDSDITPIKVAKHEEDKSVKYMDTGTDNRFVFKECTGGNIDSWNASLENEKRILEIKLQLIAEKQKSLCLQKQFLQNSSQDRNIRRTGVLFNKKQINNRVPLQHFLKIGSSSTQTLNITPQNAELVHFNYKQQNVSSVTTLDGASIIPNTSDVIGLSEIEVSFKVMPGVDRKLIPDGWIRNHFKWIVWKLASYENFSENMKNCLTLENVIQQLKYRYDREIDRAERSTLRKIYEMDDAPQKRMVLCVSQICKLENGQFELQLSDGWYSIQTSIDEVLCQQIVRRTIQVGTKLITCGAELLNCEGCHPLQCTDVIRLKITSNSTRRTKWYIKLGYQENLAPFPLKLCSAVPNGGLICCTKIFIARVYPVKYMEKQNKLTVWRNRKAEEIYAQEWENKKHQDMQKFRDAVTRDYERQMKEKSQSLNLNINDNEIRNITCPEKLFNLYQNSKDPERLQELLSSSQKTSIIEYQQSRSFLQQQELLKKIEASVGGLQMNKRDVTPLLQLHVIDVLDPNKKSHIFQIWKPSDTHFEILKESSVFYVYNVMPKKNANFSAVNSTKFKADQKDYSELNKFKRSLIRISDVTLVDKPLFNEFDTVGIIVTMQVDSFIQTLWLADTSGRLLFVKIFESSKNCLLLDNLAIGRSVAVSNLIYCQSQLEFGEAIANHLTLVTSYPQQKHLQEGLNLLNRELPNNFQVFLNECQQKVLYYIDKVSLTTERKNSSTSLVQSNSLMSSDIFDESSDVLFSMIDLDKFK